VGKAGTRKARLSVCVQRFSEKETPTQLIFPMTETDFK
jgi:hypothetical protein